MIFDSEKPDILCLQEIKLSEGQLDLELEGYEAYYNYAERKAIQELPSIQKSSQ